MGCWPNLRTPYLFEDCCGTCPSRRLFCPKDCDWRIDEAWNLVWSCLLFAFGWVLLGEKTVRTINPQFSIHISFSWHGITLLTARIVINYHLAEEPELLREETFSLNTSSSGFRLIFLLVKQITGQPLKTDKCTPTTGCTWWVFWIGHAWHTFCIADVRFLSSLVLRNWVDMRRNDHEIGRLCQLPMMMIQLNNNPMYE